MAERGCAIAAEQVFRARELMPSGRVAESESRVARNFSILGAKDTAFRSIWVQLGTVSTVSEGLWGHSICKQTLHGHTLVTGSVE